MENKIQLKQGYKSKLDLYQTQRAISLIKEIFEGKLKSALNLQRVSAPLFVDPLKGLNDNLSGSEKPVSFFVPALDKEVEVIHSLAKWKRLALKRYKFQADEGLYTDMNAIRRDEAFDNLHSIYVDQWDWEKIIRKEERNLSYLRSTVKKIYQAIRESHAEIQLHFPQLTRKLAPELSFISSSELYELYPNLDAKAREEAFCREHQSCFIEQIGYDLADGKPQSKRAPDYDDWNLNGDLLIWDDLLEQAVELSSMGIRVDSSSMKKQLQIAGANKRSELFFHQAVLNKELPLSIGGGIGQSRLSLVFLEKLHIAEVQVSSWDDNSLKALAKANISVL